MARLVVPLLCAVGPALAAAAPADVAPDECASAEEAGECASLLQTSGGGRRGAGSANSSSCPLSTDVIKLSQCTALDKCRAGRCPVGGRILLRLEPCDDALGGLNSIWGGGHITMTKTEPYVSHDHAMGLWNSFMTAFRGQHIPQGQFLTPSGSWTPDSRFCYCGLRLSRPPTTLRKVYKAIQDAKVKFQNPQSVDGYHMTIANQGKLFPLGCQLSLLKFGARLSKTRWSVVLAHIRSDGTTLHRMAQQPL